MLEYLEFAELLTLAGLLWKVSRLVFQQELNTSRIENLEAIIAEQEQSK